MAETNTPREVVARALFDFDYADIDQAERDETWPNIMCDETGTQWHHSADAALAALAQADGLAEVLAAEMRRHGQNHLADEWACLCGEPLPAAHIFDAPYGQRLREHAAAHLADVVRGWIGGRA